MDILCFSHIRWNFVYQRPQHLLNRFAVTNRVFIVEEPVFEENLSYYEISVSPDNNNLWIIVLHVSKQFKGLSYNHILRNLLDECMETYKIKNFISWYYSPMALSYSNHLEPKIMVYDCMDELSAFKFAPPEIKTMESILFSKVDLVFTGGHSLYEAKKDLHFNIHAFPSSIDKSHFKVARQLQSDPIDQASIPHPRFGFYGVIDERFQASLIDEISELKPEWQFIFLGPIIKIDPNTLPQKKNIHYLGSKNYQELPTYLSGWDIAILPFTRNEATKYISPTKTPEYLAGGKPVISTSITDVVNPYGKLGLVKIADTSQEFINAANEIFENIDSDVWLTKVDHFLSNISWDKTWNRMSMLIDEALEMKTISNNHKTKVYV